MTKIGEILRRANEFRPNQDDNSLAHIVETTTLWPRFSKIAHVITRSFEDKTPPQGITRQLSTFSWSGADEGIHEHSGFISGQIHGIELQIKLEGRTIDNQQYAILPDGRRQLKYLNERDIYFEGTFVSRDGKKGAVEMQRKNDSWHYKAFWFEARDGFLQLEQLVGPDGLIYDTDKVESDIQEITIPGTRISVARYKTQ